MVHAPVLLPAALSSWVHAVFTKGLRVVRPVLRSAMPTAAPHTQRSGSAQAHMNSYGMIVEPSDQVMPAKKVAVPVTAAMTAAHRGTGPCAEKRASPNNGTKTIWRRIAQGGLAALTEKVSGRDRRPVIKTLIRVGDLNGAFGWTVREEHVQRIRASAPPLTVEQKVAIRRRRPRPADRRCPVRGRRGDSSRPRARTDRTRGPCRNPPAL